MPNPIDLAGRGGLPVVCLAASPAAFAASPRERQGAKRKPVRSKALRVGDVELRPTAPARLAGNAACVAVLVVEAIGTLLLWAPVPLAWLWVGGRVFAVTGSLAADLGAAFFGFVATTILAMMALGRIDRFWVRLRRRAGHDQTQGALPQIAVVSATLGLLVFVLWYYVFSKAFIIPFMPSQ